MTVVSLSPIDYNSYITNTKLIDDLPCMKWANDDFVSGIGRKVQDITNHIQNLRQTERNKWKPYLIRMAYHTTTILTMCAMVSVFAMLGLIFGGFISHRATPRSIIWIKMPGFILAVSSVLMSIFKRWHDSVEIDIKNHLKSIIKKQYSEQIQVFQKLPNQVDELYKLSLECSKLAAHQSILGDEKGKILSLDQRVKKAYKKAYDMERRMCEDKELQAIF